MTTFVSLFSGVGGFDLGLESAGWNCVAQVEWDRECQHVLARHWPDIPRWGDVQTVNGAELPLADAVVFGSPCQDLSVAGHRAGLNGERSGLFHEAIRIIKEMRDATQNVFPRFVIWENVAGALSSSAGRDFGAVLDAMAEFGALDVSWRVLDAQFFGVPQRRRRVFVIADTGGHCAGAIHTELASLRRDPAPGVQARTRTAGSLTTGLGTGGPDAAHAAAGWLVPQTFVKVTRPQTDQDPEVWRHEHVAPTLNTMDNTGDTRATVLAFDPTFGARVTGPLTATGMSRARGTETVESAHIVASVTAKWAKGTGGPSGDECQNLIAKPTQVRRLTPRECERLMGWPDDHTMYRADGTIVSDSARYRMCGNGVASPVAAWIANQINTALGQP